MQKLHNLELNFFQIQIFIWILEKESYTYCGIEQRTHYVNFHNFMLNFEPPNNSETMYVDLKHNKIQKEKRKRPNVTCLAPKVAVF